MRRRDLLKYAGATALAAPFIRAARADANVIKVGVVGAKTGPLAPAAAGTFFPPWRLWAHEVNQAGGLKLKSGQRKVELVEYDDRTQPPEAIKAVERLATIDKVDWIVGLYATGFNIAAVPTFNRTRLSAARCRLRHRCRERAGSEISAAILRQRHEYAV